MNITTLTIPGAEFLPGTLTRIKDVDAAATVEATRLTYGDIRLDIVPSRAWMPEEFGYVLHRDAEFATMH